MMNDGLGVVHPRAAGLDIHKGHITATVRLCEPTGGEPQCETRTFSALASGLAALVAWLTGHRVEAAAMEATGIYWHTPWQALTDAGVETQLLHAQHVKQLRGRKTDVEDSRWLARVCQFGLGRPSFVPSQQFRDLRSLSRHRRTLVARRSQVRNQVQKVIDRGGVRIGTVLTDIFGKNGRRILDGLLDRLGPRCHPGLTQCACPQQARRARRRLEPRTARVGSHPARRPAARTRHPQPTRARLRPAHRRGSRSLRRARW